MAKSKIELDVVIGSDTVAQAETKTKSLKAQLREMKTLLASGTLDNDAFNKLAREAGQLQDRIGDVSNTVRNLASDGKTLDGLVGITEGIVGGFAAVQGITALVGEENEDLNKTLVKIQGSIAALNGIQAVNNALQKDGAALLFLSNVQTKALAAGQTFLKVTTMGSVAATYALRAALIATGIGAIVVLVAALAGAFGDVAKNTEEAAKAQKEYNENLSKMADEDMANISKVNEYYKQKAKLNGESNAQILARDIQTAKEQQQVLRDQANRLQGDEITKRAEIAKIIEKGEELKRQIELKELEIRNELRDEETKKQDEQQKKNADRLAKNKQQREHELQDQKRIAAEKLALENQIYVLENELGINKLKRGMSLQEQEILDLQLSYKEKYLLAVNNKNLQEKLDAEVIAKTQDIKDKFAAEELEKKKIADEKAIKDAEDLLAKKKELNDKEIQDFENVQQAKQTIATGGYAILNSLGEIALNNQFKNTAVGKTLALAQIVTDTAIALSSAGVAAAKASAATGNPISGIAVYATTAAQVFANAAKAKSILSAGSGAGGGGSTGGGGGLSVQNSQPTRPATFINTGTDENGFVKVVVLENDITDVQKRVKRIKDNAIIE